MGAPSITSSRPGLSLRGAPAPPLCSPVSPLRPSLSVFLSESLCVFLLVFISEQPPAPTSPRAVSGGFPVPGPLWPPWPPSQAVSGAIHQPPCGPTGERKKGLPTPLISPPAHPQPAILPRPPLAPLPLHPANHPLISSWTFLGPPCSLLPERVETGPRLCGHPAE